jgi:hypothetical protein
MTTTTTCHTPSKTQTQAAPAGLRAAFLTLTLDNVKPTWATTAANASYPHASNIVQTLLTGGDEPAVVEELDASVHSLFPNLDEEPTTATAQEAAFYVGVAVCWLLLTSITGGNR